MDSTILKSTVLNLLRFLMNSKEQEITKYQIKLQKKVTRHTASTEERENFLLNCITLCSQNRIHLVLLVSSLPIEVKEKEQLEKLVRASLANQGRQKT